MFSQIAAIGETGLDSKWNSLGRPYEEQKISFIFQLDLAQELGKPVVLHCRDTHQRMYDLCHDHLDKDTKIHMHCFTGTKEDADMWQYFPNLRFGITNLIFSSEAVKKFVQDPQTKTKLLLLETDSPFLEPKNVEPSLPYSIPLDALNVGHCISQLKNEKLKRCSACDHCQCKVYLQFLSSYMYCGGRG